MLNIAKGIAVQYGHNDLFFEEENLEGIKCSWYCLLPNSFSETEANLKDFGITKENFFTTGYECQVIKECETEEEAKLEAIEYYENELKKLRGTL
jgi:hypothetical protein